MELNISGDFTHFNDQGRAHMVDVGSKEETERKAVAQGEVQLRAETFRKIVEGKVKKGDVLAVAQVAGVMAAKKTSDIIPMAHNIALDSVDIEFELSEKESKIYIRSSVKTKGKTGAEMEALTAVSVAALTIYDMTKALERGIVITNIHLLEKSGGKSGDWKNF